MCQGKVFVGSAGGVGGSIPPGEGPSLGPLCNNFFILFCGNALNIISVLLNTKLLTV